MHHIFSVVHDFSSLAISCETKLSVKSCQWHIYETFLIKSHFQPCCWMTRTFMNLDYGLHLFHQSQQPFHSGHQGVGRLHNMFVVDGLLLFHRRQSLLSLAQGPLYLLQLPAQGFVTLLQLRFHLCVLVWNERRARKMALFYCGVKNSAGKNEPGCNSSWAQSNLPGISCNLFFTFIEANLMCQYTCVSTEITERQ